MSSKMAYTDRNCIHYLQFLIVCLCLSEAYVTARFTNIRHRIKDANRVNFLAVGDWGRKGYFNQSAVAKSMGVIGDKLGIDFVISTGDNFYNDGLTGANDSAFAESFTKIYSARSLQKPWYAILGNHDYHGNSEAQLSPLLKKRDSRWNCFRSFTVQAGNFRSFIMQAGLLQIFLIDTNPFVDKYFLKKPSKFNWKGVLPRNKYLSTLLTGLKTALRRSRATWKIVIGHHPIRTIGIRGDTIELQQSLLPILQANKVPIYINGHDHCLEHINNTGVPMEFLTSGGGSRAWGNKVDRSRHKNNLRFYYDGQGFISVQVTKVDASVDFYDVDGKTLHSFKILKR